MKRRRAQMGMAVLLPLLLNVVGAGVGLARLAAVTCLDARGAAPPLLTSLARRSKRA